MDYSDNVFHSFLGLDSENCLAVNGTVTILPVFIQNILNLFYFYFNFLSSEMAVQPKNLNLLGHNLAWPEHLQPINRLIFSYLMFVVFPHAMCCTF